MRSFKNIAELIKEKRLRHPKRFSQKELSLLLGYKNGQFISNVERGLCSVPLKSFKSVTTILEISKEELKTAILKDYEQTFVNYFNKPSNSKVEKESSSVSAA